jgi:hypothetical protein
MTQRLLLLLLVFGLVGCDEEDLAPDLTEQVDLVLSTSLCEPSEAPEEHFWAAVSTSFDIRWDTLCVRDGGEVSWYAVKVSYWEDRAEDAWNVWLIHPDRSEVRYGEATIDGVLDPNIVNPAHPDAMERVPPAILQPGDYRVEVWAVTDEYLDSQRSEVRLTITDD